MRRLDTLSFRAFSAIAVILASLTGVWALDVLAVPIPLVGYGWVAVAVVGAVVATGMRTAPEDVIEPDATDDRIETFEESTLTGRPLELYISALALWAAVSFGWVIGGMSAVGLTLIGYGWLAIAFYGAVVGAGVAVTHSDAVATAVDPSETLNTGE
ncbi:hypothetical protein [Halorubrum sp. GN11GM_10-3_MGM]|uniref:hypothetical protein n=1 Tax=Halorubrum sp. GN11GM_10-3_MGM TaxID=2518111 RepID=UPI0010F747B6|nr:hypothetical protein [Halorubrum sp. GN11GM_10-3_MGM]TKX66963.1 hypothetical protein EXE40_15510 [Halorubrum sp. GN11GM_10-3_MGM]